MTTVQKGDKVSRETKVDSLVQHVDCRRTVKPDKTSPIGYIVDWKLDFSKCTSSQILKLAADSIVIIEQQKFRSSKHSERESMLSNGWLTRTIDVQKLLTAQRVKKSPVQKIRAELDGQSVDEQRRIIRAEMLKLGLVEEAQDESDDS